MKTTAELPSANNCVDMSENLHPRFGFFTNGFQRVTAGRKPNL
jgi:hypothetical protein